MSFFKTSNYESFKDFNPPREPDSCNWVLDHPEFISWKDSPLDTVLWLSVDPGCGKSVVSRAIVDEQLASEEAVPPTKYLYFFFKEDREHRSAADALCALLHQLFESKDGLFLQQALSAIRRRGESLKNDFDRLWELFCETTKDSVLGKVICVLDALDECQKFDRDKLISKLVDFTRTPYGFLTKTTLKFVVTSRPYQDIIDAFNETKTHPRFNRLAGEDKSAALRLEIGQVIESKSKRICRSLRFKEDFLLEQLQEVIQMEHRTYIWIEFIFERIEHLRPKTRDELHDIIKYLPRSLERFYERMLSGCVQQVNAMTILQLVIVAQRPLTLSEIDVALHTRSSVESYVDLTRLGDEERREQLRKQSELFVFVENSRVYLIHPTARDFLVHGLSDPVNHQGWKHSLRLADAHYTLAKICITYLLFAEFRALARSKFVKTTGTELSQSFSLQRDFSQAAQDVCSRYDFLEYAVSHWATHFREARCNERDELVSLAMKVYSAQEGSMLFWLKLLGPLEKYPEFFWENEQHPGQPDPVAVMSYFGHITTLRRILPNQNSEESLSKGLYWAAFGGHEEVVQLLLKEMTRLEEYGKHSDQALLAACRRGYADVARLLLDQGANANAKFVVYGSALQAAASEGHEEVIQLMLDAGADVNALGGLEWNALEAAASKGHERIVKTLLDHGAKPNVGDTSRGTALESAACRGHERVVQLLLDAGADVNAKGGLRGSAIQGAAAYEHTRVVKILLDHGATGYIKDMPYSSALWLTDS